MDSHKREDSNAFQHCPQTAITKSPHPPLRYIVVPKSKGSSTNVKAVDFGVAPTAKLSPSSSMNDSTDNPVASASFDDRAFRLRPRTSGQQRVPSKRGRKRSAHSISQPCQSPLPGTSSTDRGSTANECMNQDVGAYQPKQRTDENDSSGTSTPRRVNPDALSDGGVQVHSPWTPLGTATLTFQGLNLLSTPTSATLKSPVDQRPTTGRIAIPMKKAEYVVPSSLELLGPTQSYSPNMNKNAIPPNCANTQPIVQLSLPPKPSWISKSPHQPFVRSHSDCAISCNGQQPQSSNQRGQENPTKSNLILSADEFERYKENSGSAAYPHENGSQNSGGRTDTESHNSCSTLDDPDDGGDFLLISPAAIASGRSRPIGDSKQKRSCRKARAF